MYQDLEDLVDSVSGGKIKIDKFDCAVFNGEYVTGDINEQYLQRIQRDRSEKSNQTVEVQVTNDTISLHNS